MLRDYNIYSEFTYAVAKDSIINGKKTDFNKVYKLNDVEKHLKEGDDTIALVVPKGTIAIDFDFKITDDMTHIFKRNIEKSKKIIEHTASLMRDKKSNVIIHKTPSGGFHFIFKQPKINIKNLISVPTVSGITMADYKSGLVNSCIHVPYQSEKYNEELSNNHLREVYYVGVNELNELDELPLAFWPQPNKNVKTAFENGTITIDIESSRRDTLLKIMYFLKEISYQLYDGTKDPETKRIRLTPIEIMETVSNINDSIERPIETSRLMSEVLNDVKNLNSSSEEEIPTQNKEQSSAKCNRIAQDIVDKYHIYTLNNAKADMKIYEAGVYVDLYEVRIKNIVEKDYKIKENITVSETANIVSIVKSFNLIEPNELINKEAPFNYIFFKDRIYDLSNRTFIEFSPNIIGFQKLNIPSPRKESLDIDKVEEIKKYYYILSNRRAEIAKTMTQLHAALMIRKQLKKLFFCWNEVGDTGKSTYMEFATNVLGIHNVSSENLDSLTTSVFSPYQLKNKLLNISSEADYNSMKNTRIIKQISGGDSISIQGKGTNAEQVILYAKLICITNELPQSHDRSDAFYKRMFIIPFEYVYSKKEKDPIFIKKLFNDEGYINAISHVLLEAAQEVYDNEMNIHEPTIINKLKKYYQKNNSPIYSSLMNTDLGITNERVMHYLLHLVEKKTIYDFYKKVCGKKQPLGVNNFFVELQKFLSFDELCYSRKKIEETDTKRYMFLNMKKKKMGKNLETLDNEIFEYIEKILDEALKDENFLKHMPRDLDVKEVLDTPITSIMELEKKADILCILCEYIDRHKNLKSHKKLLKGEK